MQKPTPTEGGLDQPLVLTVEGLDQPLTPGDVLDTAGGRIISFDQLIDKLSQARVVYVGENHVDPSHHAIQLRIIQGLAAQKGMVSVGMEMFDHTYQARLDRWVAGDWDYPTFLQQVHWYANWKIDDELYKEILLYVQSQQLKLVGLNVPFHLSAKIREGGLESLAPDERALLPDRINTANTDHRVYVKEIFNNHHFKGRVEFDYFYAAQCAWEDGMAQAIAEHLGAEPMVVIVGNGHIVRKFGIPERAYARTQAAFRTVYLASPGATVSREDSDFVWATPPVSNKMVKH